MKKLGDTVLGGAIVGLVLFALVGGAIEAVRGAQKERDMLPVGTPAPPFFAIRHADKQPVQSADLAGKVIVLDFWGTWCPPCRAEAPVIRDVARAYAGQDVVVLALDQEEDEPDPTKAVAEFLESEHLEGYPVAYPEPATLGRFKVNRFPSLFVIGKDGRIRFDHIGTLSESRLREEIDAALKG